MCKTIAWTLVLYYGQNNPICHSSAGQQAPKVPLWASGSSWVLATTNKCSSIPAHICWLCNLHYTELSEVKWHKHSVYRKLRCLPMGGGE